MKDFGEMLRRFMGAKGVTGAALAEAIGVSTTSVSKILKGHSKPRQTTLTRIMQTLCESPAEEDAIRKAYYGLERSMPEETMLETKENAQVEEERITRYLEVRSQAMAFKNAIARELDKAAITYHRDYCEGVHSTDFLVSPGDVRYAIESKANPSRDLDRSCGIGKQLLKASVCESVLIAIPYATSESDLISSTTSDPILFLTPKEIVTHLKKES